LFGPGYFNYDYRTLCQRARDFFLSQTSPSRVKRHDRKASGRENFSFLWEIYPTKSVILIMGRKNYYRKGNFFVADRKAFGTSPDFGAGKTLVFSGKVFQGNLLNSEIPH
jgi:hypothetical protein